MYRPQTTDRLTELDQIRHMRRLSRDEPIELEALFNSRQAAANSPEVLAAKAENERLQQQFQFQQETIQIEARWRRLFETVVNGSQPVDTTANREIIKSWLHPGETFIDSRAWFLQVLKENPPLGNQISWKKFLTKAEQKAQAESDERSLRAHFAAVCRAHGISECTANWSVWHQIADPVITEQFDGHPVVTDDEGNEYPLVPATELEKENWAKQQFDQHQADLRRMQKANDIRGPP